jgi:hypothetical protein
MADLPSNNFQNAIREHVEDRMSELEPTGTYTLKQLCADEVWKQFSASDRRCAGRILS